VDDYRVAEGKRQASILLSRRFALVTSATLKKILETAHPRLLEALRDGTLKINGAMQLCKLCRAEQLEQYIRYSEERATNK
jgi:type VI protein secretion system component Hcp